jgi:methylase of polypeptide subunit release factors
MIPAPSSITHQHLLSVIASEADDRSSLKVVDIGCGGGAMMRYLRQGLPALLPACLIEVSGFDVSDFAPRAIPILNPIRLLCEPENPGHTVISPSI